MEIAETMNKEETAAREQIRQQISTLFDGRPVRWLDPRDTIYPFDGYDRTLEVFCLEDVKDHMTMLRRLRPFRDEIREAIGGPLVTIFFKNEPKEPEKS